MRFQYLGTAAAEAFPALFCQCGPCEQARKEGGKNIRGRSGAVIDGTLMIDFPPDVYFHSIRFGIPLVDIEDLIVTHTHGDHFCTSELMTRDPAWNAHLRPGKTALRVYGNADVGFRLDEAVKKSYGRLDRGFTEFHQVRAFEPFQVGAFSITPLEAIHDQTQDCLVYIIEKDGKRLLYGHDTSGFTKQDFDYLKGKRFDLISLDCTNGTKENSAVHMGLQGVAELRDHLKDLGCVDGKTLCVVNHFSHNGALLHNELEALAHPLGFQVSYDGMVVDL